jgi:hypothetical protein
MTFCVFERGEREFRATSLKPFPGHGGGVAAA